MSLESIDAESSNYESVESLMLQDSRISDWNGYSVSSLIHAPSIDCLREAVLPNPSRLAGYQNNRKQSPAFLAGVLEPKENSFNWRNLILHKPAEPLYTHHVELHKPSISTCSYTGQHPQIVPCGERCQGEATVRGAADRMGNKEVKAEVKVENKEETTSVSVTAKGSEDKEGNKNGEITVEFKTKF